MIIILQCKLFDNHKQPNESSTNNRKSIKNLSDVKCYNISGKAASARRLTTAQTREFIICSFHHYQRLCPCTSSGWY